MVAILATVNEADNVNLVRSEGGVLPVFPLPITSAGVISVGAAAPITSTGGAAPVIGITAATDGAAGSMSAADKTKLDGIAPGAAVARVTGSNGIASSGGANPNLSWVGLGDIDSTGLVDSISGPSPILITPAALEFTQGTLAPTITQAQQANAAAPQSIALTPQAPGAAATNATNGTPGSTVVSLAAPVAGGTEATFQVSRVGGIAAYMGLLTVAPTFMGLWLGLSVAPSATNYTIANSPSGANTLFSAPPTVAGSSTITLLANGGVTGTFLTGITASGQGTCLTANSTGFGSGVRVCNLFNASTEPSANAGTATLFWAFTNGAFKWRSANGWQGNLAALGSGTLQTQQPFTDTFSAVVRTVSTANPTAFAAYTCPFPALNTIGWINVRLLSKAATTGTGIAVGDGAFAEYRLGYKNVAGTVTLSTSGLTLLGAVQTTAAALTATLTAAAAGGTVVFSVTNVALATIDSQIDCSIDVC